MVAVKKTKKTHESMNNRLALVMNLWATRPSSTLSVALKLIIISNNCPSLRKSEIEYYAMLAKVGVHHHFGTKVNYSYGTPLANVDWLHGEAESLLTLTNIFIVLGLGEALRKAKEN
ncbi:putative ribosomal protein L30e [Rosa chinensis]|uniref:Putative ribosomal protein L30e n=1 Tax=Rosa chinensis TaxID=74649 RepID=A0A2P6PYS7_ROSCH|nr:putative ribosomal protein L30e [Rosa chinensis]